MDMNCGKLKKYAFRVTKIVIWLQPVYVYPAVP